MGSNFCRSNSGPALENSNEGHPSQALSSNLARFAMHRDGRTDDPFGDFPQAFLVFSASSVDQEP
jgi:hypothetical protein